MALMKTNEWPTQITPKVYSSRHTDQQKKDIWLDDKKYSLDLIRNMIKKVEQCCSLLETKKWSRLTCEINGGVGSSVGLSLWSAWSQ